MSDFSQYFPEGPAKANDFSQYFPPPPAPEQRQLGNMADLIPGQRSNTPIGPAITPKQTPGISSLFGPATGAVEAGLSLATAPIGYGAAALYGVGELLSKGNRFAIPDAPRLNDAQREIMQRLTYQPRTQAGQDIVGKVGEVVEGSKIAGLGPSEALTAGNFVGPAISQAKEVGNRALSQPVPRMVSGAPVGPEMVGVGAAETSIPRMRIERAESLPIPVRLTKGEATRDFGQLQFERETAKDSSIGGPLRQRAEETNRDIPRNLEFFADETGAQAGSIRATGEVVTQAIADKANALKGKINAAYKAARESGEMQEPIDVTPLTKYLQDKQPQSINAGVLSSAMAEVSELAKRNGGRISINDLEEVRKSVGVAGGKDATNAHFAREIKKVIDDITEGKGGEQYSRARSLRAQYGEQFENIGIIDRLMSTKPGTKDRAIAFEDVFDKAIMGGSLDDVRAVRRTLQTGGAKGEQAWKELQGATVNNIREQITANSARDAAGNPVVSPAAFNKIVTGLDKDGKLEFIFGKQGAQKMRDLRDVALDTLTSPPGTVNASNTSNAIITALTSFMTNIPLLGTPLKESIKSYKNAQLGNQVQKSLNPSGPGGLLRQ